MSEAAKEKLKYVKEQKKSAALALRIETSSFMAHVLEKGLILKETNGVK